MEPKSIHEEFHFNSDRGVNNSLERRERAFLEKCRLWNLKLNRDKVKRHQSSVKFIGHLSKDLTLRRSWPYCRCLNLRTSLHWSDSLGWWPILQSLHHLSEMTEPLRRLDDKNVEFQWFPQHSLATNTTWSRSIWRRHLFFAITMKASQSLSNVMA